MIRNAFLHVVGEGETLETIARANQLSSWRSLYDAPANTALRRACNGPADSPAGLMVTVPPSALQLMRARLQAIHRVQPLALAVFAEQDRLLDELMTSGLCADVMADTAQLTRLVSRLMALMENGIETIAAAASDIAECNLGLLDTRLHARNDLAEIVHAGRTPVAAGLQWLVSTELLSVCYGLWSAERLAVRWQALQHESFERWIAGELNTARSRVVQHIDMRLRETLSAIRECERR
jgi:hypothetical protein